MFQEAKEKKEIVLTGTVNINFFLVIFGNSNKFLTPFWQFFILG